MTKLKELYHKFTQCSFVNNCYWFLMGFLIAVLIVTQGLVFLLYSNFKDTTPISNMIKVITVLRREYDGELDYSAMAEGAIDGMVKAVGDPYTTYMDKKFFKRFSEVTTGEFCGIGIVYGKRNDNFTVITVLDDSPSLKAGIETGDIILGVDGQSTHGLSMDQVAAKIRGEEGTEVKVQLKSVKGELKDLTLTRSKIHTKAVGGKMLPNSEVGYIRIASFTETSGDEFVAKYQELEKQGMKATILDLRQNPGGTLQSALKVAGMLVPKGEIVSVKEKGKAEQVYNSDLEATKYPLAVLVDGGSASASEIVAGAVKDRKAGKLFGEKTFGKGSVQSVYKLNDETALKVTVAKYYTPSGTCIHGVGIEPDEEVKWPDVPDVDEQLLSAKGYLQKVLQEQAK